MVQPLVSVVMTVYNHGATVRQAIESVASQKTNFDFELLIGEDCSTDDSRETILELAEDFEFIKPLIRTENLGGNGNFQDLVHRSTGKYLAICEGDDFWISPYKLQLQAEVLETDPSLGLCFTGAVAYAENKPQWDRYQPQDFPPRTTIEELLQLNFIHSCTVMYRRIPDFKFPEWYSNLKLGDWPMHILHALHGDIAFIDQPMALYRLHDGGNWSNLPFAVRRDRAVHMLRLIETELPDRLKPNVQQTIRQMSAMKDDLDCAV